MKGRRKIAMISRVEPDPLGTALERQLDKRLRELLSLNIDILFLTRYRPLDKRPDSFETPDGMDIRRPFHHFHAGEWVGIFPVLFGFQPESIHIVDPALHGGPSLIPDWFSVERAAIAMGTMTRLKRVVVSTSEARSHLWPKCKAETMWLTSSESTDIPFVHRSEATDLHVLLAGTPETRPDWIQDIESLLTLSGERALPIRLYFEASRQKLSPHQRKQLEAMERRRTHRGEALGERLILGPPPIGSTMDIVILAGTNTHVPATPWRSPRIVSARSRAPSPPPPGEIAVPEAAWRAYAIETIASPQTLHDLRFHLEAHLHQAESDAPTNVISRLHFSL